MMVKAYFQERYLVQMISSLVFTPHRIKLTFENYVARFKPSLYELQDIFLTNQKLPNVC